jgi:uncharacterized protein YjbJ (UPF0337 family)
MNRDQIEGSWKQFRGLMKLQWAALTNGDLREVDGNEDLLVSRLQERYGLPKERAREEFEDFLRSL